MIVFVGDKPSKKNKRPDVAFVGTPSYANLMNWIGRMQIHWQGFRIINRHQVSSYYNTGDQYIALGNEAEKTLKSYKIPHFKLPHPSPKNRLLNSKYFVSTRLNKCKEWLSVSN